MGQWHIFTLLSIPKTQLSSYFYVESLSVPGAFPASCLSIQSGRAAS